MLALAGRAKGVSNPASYDDGNNDGYSQRIRLSAPAASDELSHSASSKQARQSTATNKATVQKRRSDPDDEWYMAFNAAHVLTIIAHYHRNKKELTDEMTLADLDMELNFGSKKASCGSVMPATEAFYTAMDAAPVADLGKAAPGALFNACFAYIVTMNGMWSNEG